MDVILESLIIGWILTWFQIDEFFIQAVKELFGKQVTQSTYYFMFLVIGLLCVIFKK